MRLRLTVQGSDLEPTTRRRLEQRLRLSLGRFTAGIAAADFHLWKTEEGAQRRCEARIFFHDGKGLFFQEQAAHDGTVIDRVARRLDQRLDLRRMHMTGRHLGSLR